MIKVTAISLMLIPELYLDYYVTPYFIFARDTLSYFSLLGLHVAICLSPSVNTFTMVEWAILVFFVGRFVVELDQCFKSAPKELSASMQQQATRPAHLKIKSMASRMLNSYLRYVWQHAEQPTNEILERNYFFKLNDSRTRQLGKYVFRFNLAFKS